MGDPFDAFSHLDNVPDLNPYNYDEPTNPASLGVTLSAVAVGVGTSVLAEGVEKGAFALPQNKDDQGFLAVLKEFFRFNSVPLRLLTVASPVMIWKFVHPESYYESSYSKLADFSIYFVLPIGICAMIWEFFDRKNNNKRKGQARIQ